MVDSDLQSTVARSGRITLGGDLTVSRMGFGTLQLCGANGWGRPTDVDNAVAVLRAAVDAGVNLIDTADAYGPFVAEDLIAEALYPYPDDLAIATKGGQVRGGPTSWVPLGRPEYLRQCVEMSLRRLKLERIDLYQLHRVDPTVPVEDQFGLLADMQREGKLRHLGLSEVNLVDFEKITAIVDVVSVQNLYNLAVRTHEPVLKACEAQGLAFLPWYPLNTGSLVEPGGPFDDMARRHGVTPAQIALAWTLEHSPATILIPGTSKLDHLAENLLSGAIELTDEDLAYLDGLGSEGELLG
jgi:pyridoxine 4-dehydrogenase